MLRSRRNGQSRHGEQRSYPYKKQITQIDYITQKPKTNDIGKKVQNTRKAIEELKDLCREESKKHLCAADSASFTRLRVPRGTEGFARI